MRTGARAISAGWILVSGCVAANPSWDPAGTTVDGGGTPEGVSGGGVNTNTSGSSSTTTTTSDRGGSGSAGSSDGGGATTVGSSTSGGVTSDATGTTGEAADHGYFVLSSAPHNGDFGGWPTAADAFCLTELTTHTDWRGYAEANARGLLVASKVHAFLCVNPGGCTNLLPETTYVFANAGDATAGGAWFTTDGDGLGPNDEHNWGGVDAFRGTFSYWTNRTGLTRTQWKNSYHAGSCGGWTDPTSAQVSYVGASANTGASRWYGDFSLSCDQQHYIICFVNP